jgi:hypothetical protein
MKTFDRYKQNLKQVGNNIYSYDTHVAEIKEGKLHLINWHVPGVGSRSVTTSKHISYVVQQLNLEIA